MKCMLLGFLTLVVVSVVSLATVTADQAVIPKQPIYVYLYARITDQVNLGITEDRIRRVLSTIEKFRQAHPEDHVSATILFSGAVSDALAKRDSQTHIVEFVKDFVRRGVIEVGYDGTDEPTYATRPTVDLTGTSTSESRWLARKASEEKFLTEGRDPLTGAPEPGRSGGLKRMQEVFGEAMCITGISPLMRVGPGSTMFRATTRAKTPEEPPKHVPLPPSLAPEVSGDSETVGLIRALNSKAIIFGIPDLNPSNIPGFGGSRAGFSELVSPIPETPPELYWQDNVLRSSEASSTVIRLVHANGGAAPMEKLLEKADRSRVHVVHVELGDERNYLKPEFVNGPNFPALQYAYTHSGSPELPADALRAKSEVDAAFANEDALLTFVAEKFLPANPGSRFVSSADLSGMVAPPTGFSVSIDGLKSALAEFLKTWGNDTYAQPLFRVDGHYLTRAELFQVLADVLAEYHRAGKLPDAVKVIPMYGPVRVLTGHGPNEGEVSVKAVAGICADIAPGLHEQSSGPIPKNAVPIGIQIKGTLLNPAQFLKLMAAAILNPSPEAKLNIRMAYEFTGVGQLMPRTRQDPDDGFIWTLKPAQIETKSARPAD